MACSAHSHSQDPKLNSINLRRVKMSSLFKGSLTLQNVRSQYRHTKFNENRRHLTNITRAPAEPYIIVGTVR